MIGFDLETYPIGPKKAPEVIVGAMNIETAMAETYQVGSWAEKIKDIKNDRSVWFFWASELHKFLDLCEAVDCDIVAHNGAYDWSCISAMNPTWVRRIYDLFRAKKIQCTMIRSLVLMNSIGVLKTESKVKKKLAYGSFNALSYVGSVYSFCGYDLSEAKDKTVQVTYYKMIGIPFLEWVDSYRDYLVQDVEFLSLLYFKQESLKNVQLVEQYKTIDVLKPAGRRACFHYALTLASAWGVKVNAQAVKELREVAEQEVKLIADKLLSEGLAVALKGKPRERALKANKLLVKLNNKAIQKRIEQSCIGKGLAVPKTDKNLVSTNRTAMKDSGDPLLVEWANVGDKKTIWSTFLPALEKSFKNNGVLNPNFFPYSETGRVSARSPNLLNPPREGGIRETIKAREGCCFIFCDYEANELRVLAQVLLDELGRSELAYYYQKDRDFDPHTYMACRKLQISYEEGKQRKKAKDKKFIEQRQLMKCANFGFPGGMAAGSFIEFAKGYGVSVTVAEAEDLKTFFFSQFPEVKEYLNIVGRRVNTYNGQGYNKRTGILSGDRRFCQLANFYFQSLAAEGGLSAFAFVSEAAYSKPESPLYGSRPVLFVHDEIIVESPLEKAHEAALELKRLMETCMNLFTPDIPSVAEPALALCWRKDAYPRFNDEGKLIPSDMD